MTRNDQLLLLYAEVTTPISARETFGTAGQCASLTELTELLGRITGDKCISAAAAFGMVLAVHAAKSGPYRMDTLNALTVLGLCKVELDQALAHNPCVCLVTADLLKIAQDFAWESTIPCTEWATVDELRSLLIDAAKKYTVGVEWKVS